LHEKNDDVASEASTKFPEPLVLVTYTPTVSEAPRWNVEFKIIDPAPSFAYIVLYAAFIAATLGSIDSFHTSVAVAPDVYEISVLHSYIPAHGAVNVDEDTLPPSSNNDVPNTACVLAPVKVWATAMTAMNDGVLYIVGVLSQLLLVERTVDGVPVVSTMEDVAVVVATLSESFMLPAIVLAFIDVPIIVFPTIFADDRLRENAVNVFEPDAVALIMSPDTEAINWLSVSANATRSAFVPHCPHDSI
jgi:hypothetical protein